MSRISLFEIGMAGLFRVCDGVHLVDEAFAALHTDDSEDSGVNEVIFLLQFFRDFQAALVCLFVMRGKFHHLLSLNPVVGRKVIVSSVEKDVDSFGPSFVVSKEQDFHVLNDNHAEFNTIYLSHRFQLWNATPCFRAAC